MAYALPTIEQVFGQLESWNKQAADITSEDIAGENPGSMPGSENDKKAPAEAEKPDPEVDDKTVGGESNYSGEGASPGSDNPKLEPQLLEADEPVLTPEKKPLDSTDADAKTASAGNDLVSFILQNQKKELEAKKAEESKKVEAEKKAAPAPAPAKAEPAKAQAPAKKEAAPADDIVLTNNVLSKIAAVVLSRQEGRELVQRYLAEAAGEDFAKQAMDTMGLVGRKANELSEFEKGAQAAEEMLGDMQEAQGAADAEAALGAADEAQGAADAEAALGDAAAAGEGADEEYSEEEVLEAVKELVDSGEITEEQAMQLLQGADVPEEGAGEEEVTEEELAQAIGDMIQSGELPEEEAQALIAELADESSPEENAELAADVGEAAPEGGEAAPAAPAPEGAGESVGDESAEAPEEPSEEKADEDKEASAKDAKSVKKAAAHEAAVRLIDALRQKQAAAKAKKPAKAAKPSKK